MKQTIGLGAAVDDSTGDYLRQGAQKINNNFDDIYSELGDTAELHPAGAWKTHSFANGSTLTPDFGSQYNINSLGGPLSITLPKGSAADYGRVIKIRDTHASWGTNNVTIRPTSGDAIGGSTNPVVFNGDFTTLEFVYSSPATWRYVSNMKLDSLPRAEGAGVIVKTFRVNASQVTSGQFTDISATGYNAQALQVYRNGALLTYDATLANTDYGSKNGSVIGPLNGIDIYIPYVKLNDVITVITYSKDVAATPVSYIRYDVQMLAQDNPQAAVPGQSLKIKADGIYTLQDLGRPTDEEYNPSAIEILVNGTVLIEAGNAGLSPSANEDYKLSSDGNGRWNTITISPALQDGDVLSIIFFNNELGSILEWDGVDGIKERASEIFLNSEYRFNRSSKIRYTDPTAPGAATAVSVPGTETNIRFENVVSLLESIYPVGSIYINANNAANPALYMGFGTWKQFAKGRAIFGFDDTIDAQGNPDPIFGVNDSVVDAEGDPLKVAGNIFGQKQVEISKENLPELESTRTYLREAQDGDGEINLSGCIPLPGDDTEPLTTFELATVKVNSPEESGQDPADITIIPPGITAYIWVRTA